MNGTLPTNHTLRPDQPNWLLRGLVGFSLMIHLVFFLHVSGLYDAKTIVPIELTLQNISKPKPTNIPKPKQVPKPLTPQKIEPLKMVQPLSPQPLEAVATVRDLPPERVIETPTIPSIPDLPELAQFDPNQPVPEEPPDYLQIVRMRIELCRKYPDVARRRQMEGCVVIRFAISPAGEIHRAEVVKSSRFPLLDEAALRAVRDAAPFPKPPPTQFKGEVLLELPIMFELT